MFAVQQERQEQVVSKRQTKLVAHNSLNSRCWQSVYKRACCTRQPAIGEMIDRLSQTETAFWDF